MSGSLQPCDLQPVRLFHPWDFPGKNTGVGCHFLLHRVIIELYNNANSQALPPRDPDSESLGKSEFLIRAPKPSNSKETHLKSV